MEQSFYDLLKDAAFAGGGGGSPAPAPVLIEKSVMENGTYNAASDSADGYSSVTVAVPNTYSASDEGKVVSNGALVAQGSDTVTENGTVDTTLISSLLVNVAGGDGLSQIAKLTTTSTGVVSHDMYIVQSSSYFYFFGFVGTTSACSELTFLIPSDFDVTRIGARKVGARKPTTTARGTELNFDFSASNRTITISNPLVDYDGIYVGFFAIYNPT
jgi:hypothetical protein